MGRLGSSSRPRTARVTADAGRDARVADRAGQEPSCGLPGLYNDVVHAPLCDLPPLVAVRADRFRMLESAAGTRHI